MYVYYDQSFVERPGLWDKFVPVDSINNRFICASGKGHRGAFSCLMTNELPSLNYADIDNNQCFPLRICETVEGNEDGDLIPANFDPVEHQIPRGVTDTGLKHFQSAYPGEPISKEDIFYYVYGLLHSEDYRSRYANNLSKELPRIPCVKMIEDFRAFRDAGRRLGELHVNYESVDPWPVTIRQGDLRLASIDDPETFYRVIKMKFGDGERDKDKTIVIYNANITMQDIPLEAYDYVVNGKPALEWVMERQVVKTDKASGIMNDANRYAIETVGNPAYPLELFQRVITVSLQTTKIVRTLPKLEVTA